MSGTNGDFRDSTVNRNDGAVTSAGSLEGVVGGGRVSPRADHTTVADSGSLDIGGLVTTSAWIPAESIQSLSHAQNR